VKACGALLELVLIGGNLSTLGMTCPRVSKSTANHMWTALGVNLLLRVESALTRRQPFLVFYI
jgi:hypothetical protein